MNVMAKVNKTVAKLTPFLQSQKIKTNNVQRVNHRNFRLFGAVLK